jgi:peptide/nickel transport system ATP-binding protein
VRRLSVAYQSANERLLAVQDVSFSLKPGDILGIVGESGSGKSTLIKGLLRILQPPGVITGGEVWLNGRDLLGLGEEALRALRWEEVAVVPQSALNALNPVLSIGEQMIDTLRAHRSMTGNAARDHARTLLEGVGLDPLHLDSYPHQLSGGMRQRVALGLALALEPPLLIMDEPTTALDVVIEREILQRVLTLQQRRGFAMIFITHDVSLLMAFATQIGVLYGGRMVEMGPVQAFRDGGIHPYTQGLLAAIPPAIDEDRTPVSIPGSPPSLTKPPTGCPFHPRCHLAEARCSDAVPALHAVAPDHEAACHLL